VDLLALSDRVFVVDLTPETMEACRAELASRTMRATSPADDEPRPPAAPDQPLRAVALVFAQDRDPVILAIPPTADTEVLDAAARLLRMALLTRRSIANLVTELGDERLKHLYFSRRLPRFLYEGVPAAVQRRLPAELCQALGRRRRRGR